MNSEQIMVAVRQLLQIGGTVALMLGVTQGQIDQWSNLILMVAGGLSTIIGAVWVQKESTAAATVKKAAALSSVQGITVTDEKLATAAKSADPNIRVTLKPQF